MAQASERHRLRTQGGLLTPSLTREREMVARRESISARFDILFVVTAVSVLCSLSLWGALAVSVLILLHVLRTPWLLVPVAGIVVDCFFPLLGGAIANSSSAIF